MGRTSNYQANLFDEFEKLNKKLDSLLKENKSQSLTIYNLNLEIEKLNKTIQEKEKKIELLLNEIDRLKNHNNKNSNNSSKPSSTNIVTPKKKTGANLYNYRTKTGKKAGGQYNHHGYHLSKKDAEKLINENKIEVKEIVHTIKGNPSKEPLVKYRCELEIKWIVNSFLDNFYKDNPKRYATGVW